MIKLYIYDHCPYCVKARMIFGLKKIPFELICLLNDDEKTPISMIGQKMVPILETEKGRFMPESLDIVSYIDKKGNQPLISSWKESKALSAWLNRNSSLCYELAMPRWVQLPLEEFKTKGARDYFQTKKEGYIGLFKDCLSATGELVKNMEGELEHLESLFKGQSGFFRESLSLDDFQLFPFLRSLSVVKSLSFPAKTKRYSLYMSQQTGIPLHHSIAI